ncbi:MAG: tRNA pseudouridine(38-40) synthase TruA [Candidatus Sumerlaeota bacterium]|nr:tRNA pseudouridine(38-40) synthase TruA [Candidatus Sumerlaeota bacterium]
MISFSSPESAPAQRRIALLIEYDGFSFSGWQRQAGDRSVQQVMEEALEDLTGHAVRLTGAGRTDAGVHARGQVATFLTTRPWPPRAFQGALRQRLPEDVGVMAAWEARARFDPRRDAIRRVYSYRLWNRTAPPVIERHFWAHYSVRYDFDLIRAASVRLIGDHDFRGLRSSRCRAKRTRLTLERLEWREAAPGQWIMEIASRSFLHHMVRNIVGTLLEIGRGAMPLKTLDRILETGDRRLAGPTARPEGLTLERIEYPPALEALFCKP